ncbi:ATP-binding protein [Patescibacteria group bacterium]|nr:ATP-binding protein [Patescibacteria group bacterium]MBU1349815.1 ATP-binding protein [Patescibacteria group bacterium]MBU1421180.1 ATP-binding protein [Patescibacteria group bacterium]MBU1684211.1 ATP-binding protein [Patescibacteria group bacterium]MBU1987210.1 ATP-binding protein [Patescibacteria group bacterium]
MFKRNILSEIKPFLEKDQIIMITGARQVGKTSLLFILKKYFEQKQKKCFYLNLENPEYKNALNQHPQNIFEIIPKTKTKQYIFLDEAQYLDNPSNFLKFHFDENRKNLKIITTGSSAFYLDKKFKDSLAGRKFIFELYGLNFYEFLTFKNQENIKQYFNKPVPKIYHNDLIKFWKEYITFGSYPEVALNDDEEIKKKIIEGLALSYIKKDIYESGIKNSEKYFQVLKLLAMQTGQLVNANQLANITKLSLQTIENYLFTMQKSYHLAFIKPFYQNLKKELIKMPKVYFLDLGLRNYLLNNFNFIGKRMDSGQYLENVMFLRFLTNNKLNNINFWRTQNKNEVDFIINRRRAFEIKFNKNKFTVSKYKIFQKKYSDIKLNFICYDDIVDDLKNGKFDGFITL